MRIRSPCGAYYLEVHHYNHSPTDTRWMCNDSPGVVKPRLKVAQISFGFLATGGLLVTTQHYLLEYSTSNGWIYFTMNSSRLWIDTITT